MKKEAEPRRASAPVARRAAVLRWSLAASLAALLSLCAAAAFVASCSSSGAEGADAGDGAQPDAGPAPLDGAASSLDGQSAADAAADSGDPDAPWTSGIERCGNGADDDGDGLIDEDCPRPFYVGIFPPGGGDDLATPGSSHVAKLEGDLGRPLSFVQTYRGTKSFDTVKVGAELGAIWAHGSVPHLYLEPDGYTPAQVASAPTDAAIDADMKATAAAIGDALVLHPKGRLLLSFGAEMNGTWTSWGCANLDAATFIAWSRKMHDLMAAALASRGVEPRRLRWAYAPNATSSGGCGSPAAYYPGHGYVDLLGMSAYRQGTQSVADAVTTPSKQLMTDLAYPAAWQRSRFIVLQTGTQTLAGDDRGAWLSGLVSALAADPVYLGVIPFDLSDPTRDWALMADGTPPTGRTGYDAFVSAAKAVPVADHVLAPAFEPYFWDVALEDSAYPEIQALRGAGLTSGCGAAPPLFCPADAIARVDAATLLARATGATQADAEAAITEACRAGAGAGVAPCPKDPVRRDSLAAAIGKVVKATRPSAGADLMRLSAAATVEPARDATRAEAATWLVRTARVPPAPLP